MKMDEYKKTLDDVKCSDDFRNKMEKLLSQPAQQTKEPEYADSVSSVEPAPRRNWGKFAAIAAAAVLVAGGIGGGAYYRYSQIEAENKIWQADQLVSTPFGEIAEMEFKLRTAGDDEYMNFGLLPTSTVKEIAYYLQNSQWNEITPDEADILREDWESSAKNEAADKLVTKTYDDYSEKPNYITLNCDGKEPFTFDIDSRGLVMVTPANGHSTYYISSTAFMDIASIVSKRIICCSLADKPMSAVVGSSDFDKTDLSSKETALISGLIAKYASEAVETDEFSLFGDGAKDYITLYITFFAVSIYDTGVVNIKYNDSSTAMVKVGNEISYQFPPEFYTDVLNVINSSYETTEEETESETEPETESTTEFETTQSGEKNPPPWAEKGWTPYGDFTDNFTTDDGQEYCGRRQIEDYPEVITYLESLDWTPADGKLETRFSDNYLEFNVSGSKLWLHVDNIAVYWETEDSEPVYYKLDRSANATVMDIVLEHREGGVADAKAVFDALSARLENQGRLICDNTTKSVFYNDMAFDINGGILDSYLEKYHWEKVDPESREASYALSQGDIFYVNHLTLTSEGYLQIEDKDLYYSNSKNFHECIEYIESCAKYNKFNCARYLLYSPKKDFVSLEADITDYYDMYPDDSLDENDMYHTGGKGTIKYNAAAHEQKISLKDSAENTKIKYNVSSDGFTYSESGKYKNEVYSDYYKDIPQIDIEQVRRDISDVLYYCRGYTGFDIECEMSEEEGLTTFMINYTNKDTKFHSREVQLSIDDYGMPVFYQDTRFNAKEKARIRRQFILGGGDPKNITYK